MPTTTRDLTARAIAAHEALARVAEAVEDEWQYVADLGTVWRARLRAVADARGDDRPDPAVEAAVDIVVGEAALIEDPHRAIDWMSTLPQVVLLALGEAV